MCSARKRQNAAFAAIASHQSGKTSTRRKNRVPRVDISDNAERHDADAEETEGGEDED